jgi:hypothetical protein
LKILDSDDSSDSQSDDHDDSRIMSSLVNGQTSPSTAVQSIVSSYTRDQQASSSITVTKPNARVRVERRYGENITAGTLLKELQEKAASKKAKESAKNVPQHSQRLNRRK